MTINIPVKNNISIYRSILRLLNISIGLTDNEITIVCEILKNNLIELNKGNRKILRGKISNMSQYSLNNYIKHLKAKNVLVNINNKLQLHPNIIRAMDEIEFTFRFHIQNG